MWNRANLIVLTPLLVLLVVMATFAPAAGQQPRRGGVLKVALALEPATIDLHAATGLVQAQIGLLIFEGLFTYDSKYAPKPMLIDKWDVSSNRLTYTFRLRRGVRFHHGRELTSEDVVASLTRWGRMAALGRTIFALVSSITAPDLSTVVLRLKEPYPLLPDVLAIPNQAPVIYPKEVIDEAGAGLIKRFIGTGPYRLAEYVPDRYYRLERFDGYQSRTEGSDGLAGRKDAYIDSILMIPVPDPAVRVAGVNSGDFHIAQQLPEDDYARLQASPNAVPVIEEAPRQPIVLLNNREGPMSNIKIRQAFQAALDMESILRGSYGGNPRLWKPDPSLGLPRGHYLWTDAGKEYYNQKNPRRARQLLAEAGYKGEPIRWMATPQWAAWYTATQIMKPMLEAAGFKVDLQVMDWPTVITRRFRTELWDVYNQELAYQFDPSLFVISFNPAFPGFYESREFQALMTLLRRHSDQRVRREIWARAQRQFYQDAPAIHIGQVLSLHAIRRELKGFIIAGPVQNVWNAWLETTR